jgi:multidrug resistance protein, MATE family
MILSRGLLVGAAVASVLLLLQNPLAALSFRLLGGSEQVEYLAREYFHIRILAAPATIGLYSLTGWFLGMQNARIPMFITVFVNLLNIGFSFLFIKVFHMKSDGVALGTVVAQYRGLLLGVWFLVKYYKDFQALAKRKAF